MTDFLDPFQSPFFERTERTALPSFTSALSADLLNALAGSGGLTPDNTGYRYEEWFQAMLEREAGFNGWQDSNALIGPTPSSSSRDQDIESTAPPVPSGNTPLLEENLSTQQTVTPDLNRPPPNPVLVLTGLKPNTYVSYFESYMRDSWAKILMTDAAGNVHIDLAPTMNMTKVTVMSEDYADPILMIFDVARVKYTPTSTTISIKLLEPFIGSSFSYPSVGSWVSGGCIHFATAAEARMMTNALWWSNQITYLKPLSDRVMNGDRAAVKAIGDHYINWYYGRQLLPTLGKIVKKGSSYAHDTFWNSLSPLYAANEFKWIENAIAREAHYKIDPRMGIVDSLTAGTAALDGFLTLHPEVRGHSPIAIIQTGKAKTYDYSFSAFVRAELVKLNYTLKGSFTWVVRTSLKKAAETADLGFLIDGTNDAWNAAKHTTFAPNHPRGRELQSRPFACPNLPFLDLNLVQTQGHMQALGQLIEEMQPLGVAALIANETVNTIRDNNLAFALTQAQEIATGARQHTGDLERMIVEFLTMPGVFIEATMANGQQMTTNQLAPIVDTTAFRLAVALYIDNPNNDFDHNFLRRFFEPRGFNRALRNMVANGTIQNFRILDADNVMRMINTLVMGTAELQGTRFLEDPWLAAANYEINRIRRYNRDLDPFRRYIGDAQTGRFATNLNNLLRLLAGFVPHCRP